MAVITADANITGTGTIPKIVVVEPSRVWVHRLLKLNGRIITAHNRKLKIDDRFIYDDVSLLSGNTRRFIKGVKKSFILNFTFLPSLTHRTVDGQYGRDYMQSLVSNRGTLDLFIQDQPNTAGLSYPVYLTTYSEDLVRREHGTECYYYNVSLELTES
jgi:hypothetical protein